MCVRECVCVFVTTGREFGASAGVYMCVKTVDIISYGKSLEKQIETNKIH